MPTTTTEAAKIILQAAKEKTKGEKIPPFERMKIWVSPLPNARIDKTAEARRLNAVAAKKGK